MTTQPSEQMASIVCRLYEVFKVYRLEIPIKGCPCCTSERDSLVLVSKPLNELPPKALVHFAFDGLLTFGSVQELKHLLPRFLEILSNRCLLEKFGVDPMFVLGKLNYGDWTNWPELERIVIQQYLSQLWQDQFKTYIPYDDNVFQIESVLCAIAQCDQSLDKYLKYWDELKSKASELYAFDFVYDFFTLLDNEKEEFNSFWEEPFQYRKNLDEWFKQGDLIRKCRSAIENQSAGDQWRIDIVNSYLEKWNRLSSNSD